MYEQLEQKLSSGAIRWHPGAGVMEEWITDAEREIGLPLPPSYRWWLKKYGNAEVGGAEILTLAPPEFRDDADTDIVYIHRLNAANPSYPEGRLYVFQPNTEETYYFDTAHPSPDGEYPVMRDDYLGGESEVYAATFAEFLERLIDEHPTGA